MTVDDQCTSDFEPLMTTPLLKVHDTESLVPLKSRKPTPLPLAQLAILCIVRLAEPIAFTQIFPYINQMMEDLKVTDDISKIGFYSGLVDSTFALAQLFTIYQWGKLSDRIGRKPVVLIGLAGVALASTCFGMSYNLATAVLARGLAGMLSGNVAVVTSMVSEMTDETNQAKAFPIIGLSWSLGCIIGPLIGGTLSHPATQYPDLFGNSDFLRAHPYFLPCAMSSSITVLSIILALLFVDETLPRLVAEREKSTKPDSAKPISHPTYGAISLPDEEQTFVEPEVTKERAWTALEILSLPAIQSVFLSGALLSFLTVGFEVIFVLFSYTSISLGGLDRSPAQIGYAIAGGGAYSMIQAIFVFPALQARFDSKAMYKVLMGFWIFIYLLCPLLGFTARLGAGPALIWVGIGFIMILTRIACMNFPLNMILVKQASPGPEALGSTFGLQQSVSCIARALAPAFTSSLFAASVEKNIMGGNFAWFVMAFLGVVGVYVAGRNTERKVEECEE